MAVEFGAEAPSPVDAPASPAPSASPSSPASSDAPAHALPASAPPAPDHGAALQHWAETLGYRSPEDLKQDLAFNRQLRSEYERQQQSQWQNQPEYQAAARRGETFRSLVEEGYSREHAQYLMRLPELFQSNDAARAVQSQTDLKEELKDLGLTFRGADGTERFQTWENRCADVLNRDPRLNAMYYDPSQRRAAIREIVEQEERHINHVLLSQDAVTMRDAARRRAATPAAGRGTPATLTVREEAPKAPYSDAPGRRREHREITARKLDDLVANYGR